MAIFFLLSLFHAVINKIFVIFVHSIAAGMMSMAASFGIKL